LEITVADNTTGTMESKITYFITHYAIYIGITLLLVIVWKFLFPSPDKQINKPISWVAPFAKVEKGGIDQSNTQIELDGKPWEVGAGVGGFRYDNKDGYGGMVFIKRKF
jgi:hypothetical protein